MVFPAGGVQQIAIGIWRRWNFKCTPVLLAVIASTALQGLTFAPNLGAFCRLAYISLLAKFAAGLAAGADRAFHGSQLLGTTFKESPSI